MGLLGGSSYVKFNKGYLTSPIKILVNGRLSISFKYEKIPFRKLITKWVKNFFKKRFTLLDPDEDLEIELNISHQSSPGKVYEKPAKKSLRHFWFTPRDLNDLPEIANSFIPANDTSIGVGYFPFTELEKITTGLEITLNSDALHNAKPWLGSDIKILGVRIKDVFKFTLCIPQIANYVKNIEEYKKNLDWIRNFIVGFFLKNKIKKYELNVNTRDNYKLSEVYLTAIGSSIESGDEGITGRGNRINRIITPSRPISMEGSFGKNPVYHIGKIYYAYAFYLAKKIYESFKTPNEVYLVSQTGRDIKNPWIVNIRLKNNNISPLILKKYIKNELSKINQLTEIIVNKKILIGTKFLNYLLKI